MNIDLGEVKDGAAVRPRSHTSTLSTGFRALLESTFGSPGKLFTSGVICLAVSFFLPDHGAEGAGAWYLNFGYFLHEFLRDLGIAFLVAVAISVAIEQIASERRNREIESSVKQVQDNALAAVFNTSLPVGWLNFVRHTLQNRTFYRSNMRVRYDVRLPTEEEQRLSQVPFVVCMVTISYRVRNTGFAPDKFGVNAYVELPWEPELRTIPQLDYVTIDGVPLKAGELTAARTGKDWKHGKSYKHEVEIASHGSKDVEIRLRQINYPRDTTTFTVIDPADSLHVHLVAPPGFRTYVMLKHPMAVDEGEGRFNAPLRFIEPPKPAPSGPAPTRLTSKAAAKAAAEIHLPVEGMGQEEGAEGYEMNDTWVSTQNPCFPSTCVELSWSRDVATSTQNAAKVDRPPNEL